MSDETTRRMLRMYEQQASPTMFLAGLFDSRPENFHNTEEVEIDIVRSDEDVAIAIQDLSQGYRMNSTDVYTNKSFIPPIFKEAVALNAFDLLKRMPGNTPFEDPVFRANILERMMMGMQKVERKIRRSIELQAAQVLTTGVVTLVDSAGNTLYTIDYKAKTAHFPTVSVAWSSASSTKIADLQSLANVIRNNGQRDPDQLIMGEGSFEYFVQDDDVQKRYDQRRLDLGTMAPMRQMGDGGQYRGVVEIGTYRYDIWTYGGRYKHPSTGTITKYIPDDKVMMRASTGRLDATWGGIPNIARELGKAQMFPELPARFSMGGAGGMDMATNIWITPDGEQMFGGVGSRPLMIPTAIDTFGCLDTNP